MKTVKQRDNESKINNKQKPNISFRLDFREGSCVFLRLKSSHVYLLFDKISKPVACRTPIFVLNWQHVLHIPNLFDYNWHCSSVERPILQVKNAIYVKIINHFPTMYRKFWHGNNYLSRNKCTNSPQAVHKF